MNIRQLNLFFPEVAVTELFLLNSYPAVTLTSSIILSLGLKAINNLASACGKSGMVYGQYLDVKNEGVLLDIDELIKIHRLKTGKLIETLISQFVLKSLRHY